MANAAGCALSGRLAAVSSIAGGWWDGTTPDACTGAVPAMIQHGRNDDAEPFSAAETSLERWLDVDSCTNTSKDYAPYGCEQYEDCAGSSEVIFCPHDEGHSAPAFGYEAMWKFFGSHALR